MAADRITAIAIVVNDFIYWVPNKKHETALLTMPQMGQRTFQSASAFSSLIGQTILARGPETCGAAAVFRYGKVRRLRISDAIVS